MNKFKLGERVSIDVYNEEGIIKSIKTIEDEDGIEVYYKALEDRYKNDITYACWLKEEELSSLKGRKFIQGGNII